MEQMHSCQYQAPRCTNGPAAAPPWLPLEKIKTISLGMALLPRPTGFSHIHFLFLNSQCFSPVALLHLQSPQPHASLAHTDFSGLNVRRFPPQVDSIFAPPWALTALCLPARALDNLLHHTEYWVQWGLVYSRCLTKTSLMDEHTRV